jgi:hypothetical protein
MASINGSNNGTVGGVGLTLSGVPTPAPNNPSRQLFDISVLSGLKDSDKYLGKNRVSDIKESYQTYLTGSPVGRGGQYAVSDAKRFGVDIVEAARGYLATAGLPTLSNILPSNTANPNNPIETVNPVNPTNPKNPFELLADVLPGLFGNAVYNPPLQSQAYGYTPTDSQTPLQSGGSSIGTFIIIGIVGVIGYFVYKRYVK